MSGRYWSIPALWPGETGVVIGGGPSLSLKQIRHIAMARLDGKCRVLAVNDAVYCAWWADWLHACDFKWWSDFKHIHRVQHFGGIKTTLDEAVPPAWAHLLHRPDPDPATGALGGMPDEPYSVAGGGNGGYQGIQCLAKAGCIRLLLVGFDMKPKAVTPAAETRMPSEAEMVNRKTRGDWQTHFFGDHPDGIRSNYEKDMMPNFPTLVEPLKARGVEVVNCTPGSAIKCFPMETLEKVL